jgi:pimeloyl-[acyl-carrier protein] methyl ester esterase
MSTLQIQSERRGRGTATVWIHGWSAESGVWGTFPDEPGREGILVDLPGHGASPWPGRFAPAGLARAILETFEGPADFVGWSLGGIAALACALEAPGRVRSVAILSMPNFGGDRARRMRDALAADRLKALAEFYRQVWSEADRRQPGFDALQKELARKRRLPSVEAMVGIYDVFFEALPALPLERVACQALVAHGTADGVTPLARARELAARLPGARFVEIAGAGHAPFLTFPGECRAALREFWRGGFAGG